MARIFLVRHGEPKTIWGEPDADPGLSATGRMQAAGAAAALRGQGVARVLSSPMLRCRETAHPFEQIAGAIGLQLEPRVSEVVAPAGVLDRRAWLQANFPWRGSEPVGWGELEERVRLWRDNALACVLGLGADTAIFTHFVAINAIVGAALRRDETIVCKPDYASITELKIEDGALRLVRVGAQMEEGDVR